MEHQRDLAIVLRSVPYEERHRVVTALTERHGRISALARNSIQSRRFGGALEPFAAADWMFVERAGADLYRVEEAQIRRPFEGLRKDFLKLSLASVFNELMLRLAPEREPCPDLFRLHSNALVYLEEMQTDGEQMLLRLLNGYLAKLLQWNGNQPQLQACQSCQTRLDSFEPQDSLSCIVVNAGWLCPSCRSGKRTYAEADSFSQSFMRVSAGAVLDFHIGLATPIRQGPGQMIATTEEHRELFSFLEALLIYHVQGFDRTPLKGLRFLGLESIAQHPAMNRP